MKSIRFRSAVISLFVSLCVHVLAQAPVAPSSGAPAAPAGPALPTTGCPSDFKHDIILPPGVKPGKKTPEVDKGMLVYSNDKYLQDFANYQIATAPGCPTHDLAVARQLRNEIVTGVRDDIDLIFKSEFVKLFGRENGIAVTGDVLTLGLGAAGSIATHAATKTIFAALGTAFTGINLSIYKNYYGQQAFQVIGLAMENRRARLLATMSNHLNQDGVTVYSLNTALGDLAEYGRAGTLPGGLAELQFEAATANTGKAGGALSITTTTLAVQKVGVAFTTTVTAAGGTPPYVFSNAGAVNGVSLSATGVLSGTPTAPGNITIPVTVTDASKQSLSVSLNLAVNP